MTRSVGRDRLQQLKGLTTQSESLCFQVYIGVLQEISSDKEFDAIAEKYGVDMSIQESVQLSARSTIEEPFPEGDLLHMEGNKEGSYLKTQALLTISPYKINGLKWDEEDPDESTAPNDLEKIIKAYIPEIERNLPNVIFNKSNSANTDEFSICFRYIIRPYTPELCPPNELGVLKPITLIEGHVIHPRISHIDDLEQDFGAPVI